MKMKKAVLVVVFALVLIITMTIVVETIFPLRWRTAEIPVIAVLWNDSVAYIVLTTQVSEYDQSLGEFLRTCVGGWPHVREASVERTTFVHRIGAAGVETASAPTDGLPVPFPISRNFFLYSRSNPHDGVELVYSVQGDRITMLSPPEADDILERVVHPLSEQAATEGWKYLGNSEVREYVSDGVGNELAIEPLDIDIGFTIHRPSGKGTAQGTYLRIHVKQKNDRVFQSDYEYGTMSSLE